MVNTLTSERPSYSALLRNRPFGSLWVSQLVSQSGDAVFDVALLRLVLVTTGSTTLVGITQAAVLIPGVLVGPIAGVYADRLNRRNLMILSNAVQGAVTAVISLLYVTGSLSFSVLILLVPDALHGNAVLHRRQHRHHTQDIADAMELRGFGAKKERAWFREVKFSRLDFGVTIVELALLASGAAMGVVLLFASGYHVAIPYLVRDLKMYRFEIDAVPNPPIHPSLSVRREQVNTYLPFGYFSNSS